MDGFTRGMVPHARLAVSVHPHTPHRLAHFRTRLSQKISLVVKFEISRTSFCMQGYILLYSSVFWILECMFFHSPHKVTSVSDDTNIQTLYFPC